MDADKIDDDVKVLVVIHPKEISDKAQFAIDQFVLRGGKLIAFLDPHVGHRQPPAKSDDGRTAAVSSSLDKLLKAWGIQFDTSKVVADLDFKMQLRGQNGQPTEAPAWLGADARRHQPRRHRRPARLTASGCRCAARSPARPPPASRKPFCSTAPRTRNWWTASWPAWAATPDERFQADRRELQSRRPPDRQIQDRVSRRQTGGRRADTNSRRRSAGRFAEGIQSGNVGRAGRRLGLAGRRFFAAQNAKSVRHSWSAR